MSYEFYIGILCICGVGAVRGGAGRRCVRTAAAAEHVEDLAGARAFAAQQQLEDHRR